VHDFHDAEQSKRRSSGRLYEFLRVCVAARRGAWEVTTEVWRWRRLVRIPGASEKVARIRDLTRRGVRSRLEPERFDLRGREPYTGDGVDSSRRERPPRTLNLRRRDVRPAEERREPV